jgi:hypothetical protein
MNNCKIYVNKSDTIVSFEMIELIGKGTYWVDDVYGSTYLNKEYGVESGDNYPCSHYNIDGKSVWLNQCMYEVEGEPAN